jgi:hypothetical protein
MAVNSITVNRVPLDRQLYTDFLSAQMAFFCFSAPIRPKINLSGTGQTDWCKYCSDQTDGGTFYCKEAKVQRGKEKRFPPASLLLCTFAVKIVILPSS